MKQNVLVVIALFVGLMFSASAQNSHPRIIPCKNQLTFLDDNQTFVYQENDSVYVSIAFVSHQCGDLVFDVCVDNQSSDTLAFDPCQIHLFRYTPDSLAELKVYHPLDANHILDSIDNSIDKQEKKIKNKNFFSILLGAACLTAQIAGATGDMDYNTLDAIWVAHDVAQVGIDIARENNMDNIYDLSYSGDYWLNMAMKKELVLPHSFKTGNIHFKVDGSEVLKIDIPIGYRIFTYRFERVGSEMIVGESITQ